MVYDVTNLLTNSNLGCAKNIPEELCVMMLSNALADIEQYVQAHGLAFAGFDDFILEVVSSSKLDVLKVLFNRGLNVDTVTAYGPLIMLAFRLGAIRQPVILCMLNHRPNLDFKVKVGQTEGNFYDLAVFLCASEALLDLFTNCGAKPQNPRVIPYPLNPDNHDFNSYLLRGIYDPNAAHDGRSVAEALIRSDYQEYAPRLANLGVNLSGLSLPAKILALGRLVQVNSSVGTRDIIASLPSEIKIDDNTFPLSDNPLITNKGVKFEDWYKSIRTLRNNSIKTTIDPDYAVKLISTLKYSGQIPDKLRGLGVDFNKSKQSRLLPPDWQIGLLSKQLLTDPDAIGRLVHTHLHREFTATHAPIIVAPRRKSVTIQDPAETRRPFSLPHALSLPLPLDPEKKGKRSSGRFGMRFPSPLALSRDKHENESSEEEPAKGTVEKVTKASKRKRFSLSFSSPKQEVDD